GGCGRGGRRSRRRRACLSVARRADRPWARSRRACCLFSWVPAFAGMTNLGCATLDRPDTNEAARRPPRAYQAGSALPVIVADARIVILVPARLRAAAEGRRVTALEPVLVD